MYGKDTVVSPSPYDVEKIFGTSASEVFPTK